ncbi:MAG: dihydropteroate synthase, partial [Chloroflexota bacterium]
IINSIGGFDDPAMIAAAVETGAAVVVMHIQGQPRVHQPAPQYVDVVAEVRAFLIERTDALLQAGIAGDRIIIDPGPGFGKTTEHDLAVLRGLSEIALAYPLLLATSRKKFIGDVLGAEADDRLDGSLATAAWGVLHGAKIIRTHDVRATSRVVRMIEAVEER